MEDDPTLGGGNDQYRYAPRNNIRRGPWHYLHRCRDTRDGWLPDGELTG
jgi:hypothetical protein